MSWSIAVLALSLATAAAGCWAAVARLLDLSDRATARERDRADKLEAMLDEIRARELRVELPATVAPRPTPIPLPQPLSQYLAGLDDADEREVIVTLARAREAEGHSWDEITAELMGT